MAILKLNNKELNESRKEILKDVSIQEIRENLYKMIDKEIEKQIIKKIKDLSFSYIERKIQTSINKKINSEIKDKKLLLKSLTKEDILKKIDVENLIDEVKSEIKSEVLKKLGNV